MSETAPKGWPDVGLYQEFETTEDEEKLAAIEREIIRRWLEIVERECEL